MCWWRKSGRICDIKATLTCCELFWYVLVSSRLCFFKHPLNISSVSVWCWCSDMKICSISRLRMWQLRSTRKKIRGSAAPLEGGRSLWEATKKEAFLLNSWSLVFIRQINYFIHCVYWNDSGYVFCCTATLTNSYWFHEFGSLVHGSLHHSMPSNAEASRREGKVAAVDERFLGS